MSDESQIGPDTQARSIREILRLKNTVSSLWTILISLIGAGVFIVLSTISMPFIAISLFKFGILPTVIAVPIIAAFRGPLAGFFTGYLGVVIGDLVLHSVVVNYTLQGLAYGFMGLVVGLAYYNFVNGRSLVKLAILSIVGLAFTGLLLVVVGILIEGYSVLIGIGFVLLPILTQGIPTVLLFVPVFAKIIHAFELRVMGMVS
ncbi:hypothetical protein EU522_00730 [Candidatus Thorarchaeota archaeon]|nr:MAG: hypothetical protein EU522_00730 [Candidatus Thorarchaeota archaeon]